MILAILGIILGGVVKGATGAGAPLVGLPALAMVYDIRFAVAVYTVPNLLTNLGQGWAYRRHVLPWRFVATFSIAGAIGAVIGTFALVALPEQVLQAALAAIIVAYIVFRIAKPGWSLPLEKATPLAPPMGLAAGVLQGAAGISAPASLTFLNAMKLERPVFIATISAFFVIMTVVQIPALFAAGLFDRVSLIWGLGTMGLIFAAMPLGNWLARHLSRDAFDKLVLALLALLAARLGFEALA